MATPFRSPMWALWVQPEGPNTTNYYLGCHTLDDVETPGETIKDLIRCFQPDGSLKVLGRTKNPAEQITTSVTGLLTDTASWLEKIVQGANCPFPLYVNGKACPPYDVFPGAVRWFTLENAEIATTTLMGLANRDEDNESEQAFAIEAWPPLIRGWGITTDRITFAGTENLNDIASCSVPRCTGDCGAAVDACDMLVAVADADPASADVWFSFDNGATWTAATTVPYAGPVTDLKSVVCFPIDEDTTRVIVAREAVTTAPAAIYYTDDDGANWTEVLIGTDLNMGAVYGGALFALDWNHIWFVTEGGGGVSEMWFSSDGGLTWTEQTLPAGQYYAVWFSDADTGMTVGVTDVVAITTDGGLTWAAATATGGGDTNLIVTENAGGEIWWIGTNAGEMWYSSDHGTTWAQRAFPGDSVGEVKAIDFTSETVGFMGHSPSGVLGRVYRTRDGGFTWELESATFAARINSLVACTTNQAFSVGDIDTTGLVLKTHD